MTTPPLPELFERVAACTCSAYPFPHRRRSGACRWPGLPSRVYIQPGVNNGRFARQGSNIQTPAAEIHDQSQPASPR